MRPLLRVLLNAIDRTTLFGQRMTLHDRPLHLTNGLPHLYNRRFEATIVLDANNRGRRPGFTGNGPSLLLRHRGGRDGLLDRFDPGGCRERCGVGLSARSRHGTL